jgi:hypothetical protein
LTKCEFESFCWSKYKFIAKAECKNVASSQRQAPLIFGRHFDQTFLL